MNGSVSSALLVPALVVLVGSVACRARRVTAGVPLMRRLDPLPEQGRAGVRGRLPEWPGCLALRRALASADVAVSAERTLALWLSLTVASGLVGALLGGPGGIIVAVVCAAAGPPTGLAVRAGRCDQRLQQLLPPVLESVASSLRAGLSLRYSLAAVADAPTGSAALDGDLHRVASDLSRGVNFETAILGWRNRRPVPGVRLAAAALTLGAESGGARARALDGVATTLRDRTSLGREVGALSAQARASGAVIVAAPVGFAALGLLSSPGVATFLFRTPAGLACLLTGLALDSVAGLWMARLTRAAT